MDQIARAHLGVEWVVIALVSSACTTSSLRYTFRDPGQVSPPSAQRTLVVYPGRKTPRQPDGSAQLTLVLARHQWTTDEPITYRNPNGTTFTVNRVWEETDYTTLVTDWNNVTIEQTKTPNRYLGVMSVVTAVCISPFLMLDSVDANGPLGYTMLGLTAGGIGLALWPASTTTLWAPPP